MNVPQPNWRRTSRIVGRPSSATSDAHRCDGASQALFWTVAVLCTAIAFVSFYWPFIAGQDYHFHDSSAPATEIGLFYDRFLGRDSWLWSTALNGGQPLWVSLEISPFFDPIAFVVYPVAVALKAGWWAPYHVTVFAWMFVLSLGGGLCTQQLTQNRWAALLTFLLLFAGPLALAVPAQTHGFLVPFRYFPLALYFYLRLRQTVTPAVLLYFVTTVGFGLAGYQSVYFLVLFVVLGLSEIVIGPRAYLAWLGQLLHSRNLAFFLVPLAAAAPLVLWLAYLQDMVAISRIYRHGHVYFFELSKFASNLLTAYLDTIRFKQPLNVWHGSTFLGMFVLPFIFLGFRRSALAAIAAFRPKSGPAASPTPLAALWLWLLMMIALTCGLFGLWEYVKIEGALFGIRNYGFLLTGCLLTLALLAGYGVSEVAQGRYGVRDVVSDTLLFGVLAAICLWLVEGHRDGVPAFAALTAVFAGIALIWLRLAKGPGTTVVALSSVLVIFVELIFTNHLHTPSLRLAAAHAERPEAADLARTREPRLGQAAERLPAFRNFEYLGAEYWPYHFEGPAVFKVAYAFSEPYHQTPLSPIGMHGLSHLFRIAAYDELLRSHEGDPETLKAVLGVSRPVLELLPRSAFGENEAGGLALVLQQDGPPRALPEPNVEAEDLQVSAFAGDRLAVEVTAREDAVLVYRDNMAPGWRATVDGTPADLLVVDGVNKAVAVPPGRHRVEFVYRPWPYLVAFTIRALVLLGAAAACLWIAVGRLRPPRAT